MSAPSSDLTRRRFAPRHQGDTRGRRRRSRLLWQAPLALTLAGIAVLGAGVRFELVGCLYLAAVTPELCRVDLAEHRLPNALVLPGLVFAGVGIVFGWLRAGDLSWSAVLCAVAIGAFFALLSVAGGMGMGDVKLAMVLALTGGAVSVLIVVGTVMLGFVLAGATALARVASRGASGDLALGPYLLGGFWASLALVPLS